MDLNYGSRQALAGTCLWNWVMQMLELLNDSFELKFRGCCMRKYPFLESNSYKHNSRNTVQDFECLQATVPRISGYLCLHLQTPTTKIHEPLADSSGRDKIMKDISQNPRRKPSKQLEPIAPSGACSFSRKQMSRKWRNLTTWTVYQ